MRYTYGSPTTSASKTLTADVETHDNVDVIRYKAWLAAQASQNNAGSAQEESNWYSKEASRTITIGGQEISSFAPYRDTLSARQTLTFGQAVFLITIGLLWVIGLIFYGIEMVVVTFAAIVVFYLIALLLSFFLSTRTLDQSPEEQIDDAIVHALANVSWPRYTILCPLYHEAAVVPQFVQAMQALDYPTEQLEILLLTEKDDAETRGMLRQMHLPPHFKIVTVPAGEPRTKPRACNFGLLQATGDYVVIYDAEDMPEPLQLKKAILAFANNGSDLACVQAKLNYYNVKQNVLTRWFTVEYSLWFDLILPGMQQARLPLPLGGTSNHFRTETLRQLGAWDAFNVTEDCDLGLRLARSDFKTVMLNSTTYEEANSQAKNWLRQRSRWIKGYMQTYLVHTRLPLYYLRRGHIREFLSLQLLIGGKTVVLFVNPFMWLLLLIYILFHPVALYHALFPAPILYMGTFCFIFGNFFYAYSHLVSCLKRGQFELVKWALLIPFYWMMISTAAFIAFFQLIFKPHYWEKTQHGLHLQASHSSSLTGTDVTQEMEAITSEMQASSALPTTPLPATNGSPTQPALPTTPLPVEHLSSSVDSHTELLVLPQPKRQIWHYLPKDPWLIAAFVIACIASVASCWYFFQHHDILLYSDSISHLRIARRVVDNTIPGLAQLGAVWLPLPHLLMLPFIWNYYLWRTGLAGSFAGMFSYLVAVVYLFLAARRLTHNSRAGFIGTLLFILNPNVLYLQSTPLDELVCIATIVMTCYYFLAWTQENHPKYLAAMAASSFLASLARYDGWGLFLVLLVLIAIFGWIKRQRWAQIEANLLVFGTLGGLGIALWFLWCAIIFGNPLYFHIYVFGPTTAANTHYYTYHNLWQSIYAYLATSIETIGPILFVLGVVAVLVFAFRLFRTPNTFGALAFLTPFVFYILVFYTGQDTIFLPPNTSSFLFWNVRFGAESVAPAAFFLSLLATRWSITRLARLWTAVVQIALVLVICVQTVLVAHGGIISLQDGLYGKSCLPAEPVTIYLAQHYIPGARILTDVNAYPVNEADIGMNLKNAIYEGSGPLWNKALANPASVVDWIIVPTDLTGDPIAAHINMQSPAFLSQFRLVVQNQGGLNLFQRKGLAPLPTRPIPSSLLTDHQLCKL